MDTQQLEQIVQRHADTLYRVAFQYLRSAADAEDAMQEALLECCRRQPAFESEAHERYWLVRVTLNKCRSQLRSLRRRPTVPLEEADVAMAPEEPSWRALYDAVGALPRKQRIAVALYYGEGYAVAEVAALMRSRESTVRTWLHRARQKLKEQLKEAWEDDQF